MLHDKGNERRLPITSQKPHVTTTMTSARMDKEYVDTFVDKILDTLVERDPDQPEFRQAVEEVGAVTHRRTATYLLRILSVVHHSTM